VGGSAIPVARFEEAQGSSTAAQLPGGRQFHKRLKVKPRTGYNNIRGVEYGSGDIRKRKLLAGMSRKESQRQRILSVNPLVSRDRVIQFTYRSMYHIIRAGHD
jgi:hypothetical protein